jgi:GT2 family glycosyltransferase
VTLAATVVVATYRRPAALARLLEGLGRQEGAPDFEVVLVDDGSPEPAAAVAASRRHPFPLTVLAQANSGAARARDRGIAVAGGEVVIVVDDDMEVGPGFVAAHLARHAPGSRRAVLGRILPPEDRAAMPLFERWHAVNLDRFARRAAAGEPVRGNDLCTGNVSFRRADYLAVGGFDVALPQGEDAELGLRLEAAGVELVFAADAWTRNGSDHVSLERWRRRAHGYGLADQRIAAKHAGVRHARPWRLVGRTHRAAAPALILAAILPALGRAGAAAAWALAAAAERRRLDRLAHAATTVSYQLHYLRGVHDALGGAGPVLRDVWRWYRPAGVAGGRP